MRRYILKLEFFLPNLVNTILNLLFNLPRENGGRGFSNLEILLKNQIASLKNYFLNRARDNTFFNALVLADKGYTPLNFSDNKIFQILLSQIYLTL
jgi:hypothetical protein